MSTTGEAISQVKASFFDCTTYVIPGACLLLLLPRPFLGLVDCDYFGFISDRLSPRNANGWESALILVGMIVACYITGLLLGLLDFWWLFPLGSYPDDEPYMKSWRSLEEHAKRYWKWNRPASLRDETEKARKWCVRWFWWTLRPFEFYSKSELAIWHERADARLALRELAEAFVTLRAPIADPWVERYCALENLCGGLKWATLLGLAMRVIGLAMAPVLTGQRLPIIAVICLIILIVASYRVFKFGQVDYQVMGDCLVANLAVHLLGSPGPPAEPALSSIRVENA